MPDKTRGPPELTSSPPAARDSAGNTRPLGEIFGFMTETARTNCASIKEDDADSRGSVCDGEKPATTHQAQIVRGRSEGHSLTRLIKATNCFRRTFGCAPGPKGHRLAVGRMQKALYWSTIESNTMNSPTGPVCHCDSYKELASVPQRVSGHSSRARRTTGQFKK